MTSLQIEYFCMAYRMKSITRTAEHYHVSQPAVSKAVSDLEKEAGVRFFRRVNNRLYATPEGEYFYGRISRNRQRMMELEQQMIHFGQARQELNLVVPHMTSILVTEILMGFQRRCPDIRLNIRHEYTAVCLDLIRRKQVDMVFCAFQEKEKESLHCVPLLDTETRYCVCQGHPLAKYDRVTPAVIGQEPLILVQDATNKNTKMLKRFEAFGIVPNVMLYADQAVTACRLVEQGVATAFLADQVARAYPGIHTASMDPPIVRTVGALWNRRGFLFPNLQQMIDYVLEFHHQHYKGRECL